MGSRHEFNKQETVRHIRNVFMELYAQNGINNITINALCKECNISRSTFYLYFDDKYQVLESVEDELLSILWGINLELDQCDLELVKAGKPLPNAYETVRFLKENAEAFKALLGTNGDPRFTHKFRKDIERSFLGRFWAEKGNPRDAGIACTLFASGLIALYTHLLFDNPQVTEEEFSIILGNLLKYSLFDFHAFAKGD